jgi:peptide/nickel transport system substrate-binding protein/oligopeptide transport system substrate-binding protein
MKSSMRWTIALVAVGALAIGTLVGCAPTQTSTGGSSTTPVKGGTFSYYIGDPAYIDPYNAQETEGVQVVHQLFSSLTAFDPINPTKLVPAAASSWSANSDATVWTFKLNPADKFSDGNPVKAQDFVYAWNRIASPKTLNTSTGKPDPSGISYHLAPVKGYDAVQAGTATAMAGLVALDDNTLQVTLTAPFGDFEYVVAHPALAPVEQSLVESGVEYNGAKVAFGDMPVGNGPFKMAEPWKHGQYVKVVRNDSYFGQKPYIDGIDFQIFKDPDTAYMAFQAGTLDFAQVGQGQIKAAETANGVSADGYTANPGKQVLLGAEDSTYYLVVNLKNSAMQNLNLRKAISLGIDRQAICDVVFDGTREPADNIVPPGIAGYQPGSWAFSKYDVTAAKAALVAAGYPGGAGAPEISLAYNADGGHQKIMELVQADLTAIGLKVKLAPVTDFPTYLKELGAGQFQIGRLGWVADYPIFDNFMNPLFNSTSADNYSKFSDPAVDSAIAAARKITNTSARIAAYQAIDKMIGEQLPDIPLMFYKHHHVTSSRVHGFVFSSMYLADFTNTWLSGGSSSASTTTTP